jgi:hypothetical protein
VDTGKAEVQVQISCNISVPVWYWISARSVLKSDFTPDVNRADFQHGRYPWMMEHITRTIGSCVAVIDEWLLRS